jgi:thiamine-monophosphate kinase
MAMSSRGEFGFIDYINAVFPVPEGTVGIGDDCAVLPAGEGELLFSTDLLMEGVHFLRSESSPEDVGWKAAAVNLSDIAAMGGKPVATFLSIALPRDAQGEWAERFIEGYRQISSQYDVPLLGGDTTSSLRDIAVNVGILGRCQSGKRLMRGGAKVGETIYVTGPLGDSAAGLQAILKGIRRSEDVKTLIEHHKRPLPRVDAGVILIQSGKVGAMMDISDGIASDMRHIMKASKVGAVIALDRLPLSSELISVCAEQGWDRYWLSTSGGEDFELLFTGPDDLENELDIKVYPVGKIVDGNELTWTVEGSAVDYDYMGYKHF